ncbi:MAG: SDR family NAD(P)-dependent oxidoreductase [Oscillibacter sp.]|nr:SDR family NAD(P)-dependent oxidoreductase [Oscillibacter sp.]
MKTAILTGASSGLGVWYAKQIRAVFPEIECLWLVARREERLAALASELGDLQTVVLPLDLQLDASVETLKEKLAAEQPDVALLINNAGLGYLGNVGEGDWRRQTQMIDVNVRALTAVTHVVLPYMHAGGHILNTSSIASFCANARLNTYSAAKAYVSSFTRGLAVELAGSGVTATAVCPGPMATEFLSVGGITGNSKSFESLPYCDPRKVTKGALEAARKGKTIYTPTAFYKLYRLVAKVLPHALVARWAKC